MYKMRNVEMEILKNGVKVGDCTACVYAEPSVYILLYRWIKLKNNLKKLDKNNDHTRMSPRIKLDNTNIYNFYGVLDINLHIKYHLSISNGC
jgi:hypothetical protein